MESEKESCREAQTEKKKIPAGRILDALILLAALLVVLFLVSDQDQNNTYRILAIAAVAVIVMTDLLIRRFPVWLSAIALAVMPVGMLCLMECYTHVPKDLTPEIFLFNLVFYYLVCLVGIFLTGQFSYGFRLGILLFLCAGLTNYYVVAFRGSPIMPWDIFSVKTAASVAGNYSFSLSWKAGFVLIGFAALFVIAGKTKKLRMKAGIRIAGLLLSLGLTFGYVSFAQTDTCFDLVGLDTTLFTPNVLYRNNGLMGGFLSILQYIFVEKPDGYSVAKVEEILEQEEKETVQETGSLPNVIVIMNEAFSDLAAIGEFGVTEDYMPFIHSIQDSYTSGNLYVSVKGGNTANSEYEFLTGDSMAFLPAGSIPYQQYVKQEMPTLASYLSGLGYSTTAIHPYNRKGWNRDVVYDLFGFDTFLDKTDFKSPYRLRDYISDKSAFEKIIELYENKEEDQPMFVFEVTMQNHGGYHRDVGGFEPDIFLTDKPQTNVQIRSINKYMSLIRESDIAFEMLCKYFEEQEEDTIILMFGDHEPSDYITNPIYRLCGMDPEDLSFEDREKGYVVPFILWSNFEQEPVRYEQGLSVNYLSGLLLETANIPLTSYMKWEVKMRDVLPVISANMVMEADGTMKKPDEIDQNDEWYSNYHILNYNHLSDAKNTVWEFFN